MALEHGDLFFVNRAGATYKIEAVELGDYLTNNPLPGSTEYIVNNGMLSIANQGNANLAAPIGIHSANTATDSILDFVDYFVVQRKGTGATVTLNFGAIKEDFLCNTGADSGFDTTNCDCLALDFGYISQRLPCPDGAIVDDNGCLEINYCKDGMLTIAAREGNCLDVKVCTDRGMDISQGCIGLDMDYIVQNITCQDVDSGLVINGSCLSVNFDKVQAKIPLGVIKSSDQTVKFKNGGNQDLKKGDVDLSVDWTKAPFSSGGGGGGGGGGTADELNNFKDCVKSPLMFDNSGCIAFNPDPDECATLGTITSNKLINEKSGNPPVPGITIGIADDGTGNFIGFCGSAKDHRLRLVGLDGFDAADACSAPRGTGKSDMCFFMRDNVEDDADDKDDHCDEKRVFKNSCIPLSAESGKELYFRASGDRVKAFDAVCNNPDSFGITIPREYSIDNNENFNLDTIFDALAGVGLATDTAVAGSLIKWERTPDTFYEGCAFEDTANPQPFVPVLRADRLSQLHPCLAEYAWDENSFEKYAFADDDPEDPTTWGGRKLKTDPDQRSRIAVKPNVHALIAILFAANRRQKARITDLESSVAALEARLTAAGIP